MVALQASLTSWTGKTLGATAALILAPPNPIALVGWLATGILLGHGVDCLGAGRLPLLGRQRQGSDRASLRFTFAALGRIAHTAENPDPAHVGETERLMTRLAFTPERRLEALGWFHAGRDSAFPFDAVGTTCRGEFAAHPVLEGLAIGSLCRMAALAGTPQAASELVALGERVGWQSRELARQVAMVDVASTPQDPLERARAVLGVGPDDSRECIRVAYRRRCARWHRKPLPARATAEEHMASEHRLAELRRALEILLDAAR